MSANRISLIVITLALLQAALVGCGSSSSTAPMNDPVELANTIYGDSGEPINLEYELSSYEWDFEPWATSVGDVVLRHWVAPYAYRLGVVYGYTTISFNVSADGMISDAEIVGSAGHETLHTSSLACIESIGSLPQLPASYDPDELGVTLRFVYPRWSR